MEKNEPNNLAAGGTDRRERGHRRAAESVAAGRRVPVPCGARQPGRLRPALVPVVAVSLFSSSIGLQRSGRQVALATNETRSARLPSQPSVKWDPEYSIRNHQSSLAILAVTWQRCDKYRVGLIGRSGGARRGCCASRAASRRPAAATRTT